MLLKYLINYFCQYLTLLGERTSFGYETIEKFCLIKKMNHVEEISPGPSASVNTEITSTQESDAAGVPKKKEKKKRKAVQVQTNPSNQDQTAPGPSTRSHAIPRGQSTSTHFASNHVHRPF